MTSELTFVIPDAIQDDFYNDIDGALSALQGTTGNFNFQKQASKDAEGNYSYPNGVTAMLTMGNKATLLNNMLGLVESKIITDNELEQENIILKQLKATNAAKQDIYDKDLKTWKDALAA
ncbi:MAG: hypothetical protein LUE99_12730 [Bacteroides sp.]|nr:hypothetical protein [Bacteroides sp.]